MLALVAALTLGQACQIGFGPTYYPVQQPTYYQPPTYHQPTYYPPVQPLLVGVPVTNLGLNHYYTVGAQLRAEAIAQQVQAQVRQALQQALPPQPQPQPQAASPPQPPPGMPVVTPTGPPPNTPPAGAAPPPAGADPLEARIKQIADRSCTNCHAPDAPVKGVRLYDGDALYRDPDPLAEVRRRSRIFRAVAQLQGAKPMPKNAAKLPGEDVDAFFTWFVKSTASGSQ